MSTRLDTIDLSTLSQTAYTTIDTKNIQLTDCDWITFQNESPYTVELIMGSVNIPIPGWDEYPIQLQKQTGNYRQPIGGVAFPPQIMPVVIASTAATLSTQLLITLYATGETPASTAPRALNRQSFVPNAVNSVGGTASAVQNDGNTSGTSVVEATVQGDGASAISLTNNGHLSLGTITNPAQLTLVCAVGDITIDTNGKVTIPDRIIANLLIAQAANDLALQVATGQRVVDSVNGVATWEVNDNGAELLTGTLTVAGLLNFPYPTPAQSISSNGTILLNTTTPVINLSISASVTGIIMTAGSAAGQVVLVYVSSGLGNTLTFAGAGSNVRGGNGVSIKSGMMVVMLWDGGNWTGTF